MLSRERKEILIRILNSDENHRIIHLEPREALIQINNYGYSFTLDELMAFGEMMKQSTSCELDFEALGSVAGGVNDDVSEDKNTICPVTPNSSFLCVFSNVSPW